VTGSRYAEERCCRAAARARLAPSVLRMPASCNRRATPGV